MITDEIPCLNISSVPFPQRIVESLGRLQSQMTTITPTSFYVYDLVEQRTICSSCSVAEMLGYTAEAIEQMGLTGLADLIHPQDLDRVSDHYQRFTTLQSGDVIQINYRMKQADGSWCCLRSRETPLVIAIDGFPLQVLGIVQVITRLSLTNPQNHPLLRRFLKCGKSSGKRGCLTLQK